MSDIHVHFKTIDATEWIIDSKEEDDAWELISCSGATRSLFDGICVSLTADKNQVVLRLELEGAEYGLLFLTASEYRIALEAYFGEPNVSGLAEFD